MRHPPSRLLLAPAAALLTLAAGVGPAFADQAPAPAAGTATPSTAPPPAGGGTPGTSVDPGAATSGTGSTATGANGKVSACDGACVASLDELIQHMLDVLHAPASSPPTSSPPTATPPGSTPPTATPGGGGGTAPPTGGSGGGSGGGGSTTGGGSSTSPTVGAAVTVTTADGTQLTGSVTAVSGTKLTVTLAAPGSPPGTKNGGPPAANGDAAKVLTLINADRAKAGCPALTDDPALDKLAAAHSTDIAARNVLTHTDAAGADPYSRAQAAGITALRAENVASGQTSADQVVSDWLGSAEHKKNIETCAYTTSGVGSAKAADGTVYWTQDFGVAVGAASGAPVTGQTGAATPAAGSAVGGSTGPATPSGVATSAGG